LKKCAKCEKQKALNDFFYVKARNGYSARCKNCHGKEERVCVVCQSTFVGASNKKLCSDACKTKYRPQTFKICIGCKKKFGPVGHLGREYCSKRCWYDHVPRRIDHKIVSTKQALRCGRQTRYLIAKGDLIRPNNCEECGTNEKYIEAAHYHYDDPKAIRWLCRSCHVKWDRYKPKGGTMKILKSWQDFTGKEAIKL
jgi:hypothetical protein